MASSELPSAVVPESETAQYPLTRENTTSSSSSTLVDHAITSRVVDITPASRAAAESSTQIVTAPLQTPEPILTSRFLEVALDVAVTAALARGRMILSDPVAAALVHESTTPSDPPLPNTQRPTERLRKPSSCCSCLVALFFICAFVVIIVVADAKQRRNGDLYQWRRSGTCQRRCCFPASFRCELTVRNRILEVGSSRRST
jgi:hypothetical protein